MTKPVVDHEAWIEGRCFNYRIYKTTEGDVVADIKPDTTIIHKRGINEVPAEMVARMIADLADLIREMVT